jgi:hypothetical protein
MTLDCFVVSPRNDGKQFHVIANPKGETIQILYNVKKRLDCFVPRNDELRQFIIFSLRKKNSFAPRHSPNKFGSALGLSSFHNL